MPSMELPPAYADRPFLAMLRVRERFNITADEWNGMDEAQRQAVMDAVVVLNAEDARRDERIATLVAVKMAEMG